MTSRDVSQGKFHVERQLSGAIKIECPPVFLVSPELAVQIAQGILREAGVHSVIMPERKIAS